VGFIFDLPVCACILRRMSQPSTQVRADSSPAHARASSQTAARAWLVPLSGPALPPIELVGKPEGVTIGRHEQCDARLPPDADKVSRVHARFAFDSRIWRVADMRSRWGTFLNGVKLDPAREMPLSEGDLIRVTPWTFSFTTRGPTRKGLKSADDGAAAQTMVRRVEGHAVQALADDMLALLLETAAAIHAAPDEKALAESLLEAAARGSGLPNAALLRPLDNAGTIEIVASRRQRTDQHSAVYSRSLLAAAAQGEVAELSGGGGDVSQSIVQMQIDAAICVPLMLGAGAGAVAPVVGAPTGSFAERGSAGTVAAYLYLDSRGGQRMGQRLRPNASAFCQALGRMASLALANLKRGDIERRQAAMEAELSAAAAAQQWILPRRESQFDAFRCIGQSRPGAYLGGDFFDIILLDKNRLAVALGDVTGHGVAASVLMTAAQGFLHALLRELGDAAKAVTELNRFINPRRADDKFVTLWVGVFDAERRTLRYVDAGHGYALIARPDHSFRKLDEGDGLPVGLTPDGEYQAAEIPLVPGERALIISDGIVEQYGLTAGPDGSAVQGHFDVAGVERCIRNCPADADLVAALFKAVEEHAGTASFQDDATAVLVQW
jgi:serine phosphatase RsbU (regulator of sigma subunit)